MSRNDDFLTELGIFPRLHIHGDDIRFRKTHSRGETRRNMSDPLREHPKCRDHMQFARLSLHHLLRQRSGMLLLPGRTRRCRSVVLCIIPPGFPH